MKKSLMVLLLSLSCLFVSVHGESPYPTYRVSLVASWTPPSPPPILGSQGFALTSISDNGRIAAIYFTYDRSHRFFTAAYWYAGNSNYVGDTYYQFNGPPTPRKAVINSGGQFAWATPVGTYDLGNSIASISSSGIVKSLLSDTNLLDSPRGLYGIIGGAAYDISDSGIVVGEQSVELIPTAFIWKPSEYLKLITPSSLPSQPEFYSARANGVNNHGQYVGYEMDRAAFGHGGAWTNLNDLMPTNSGWVLKEAFDINDNNQIVGIGITNDQEQAFLWQNGNVSGLGSLGTGAVAVAAINLHGQVVGTSDGRAFVWENGVMTDLNTLIPEDSGWVLTSATDINNQGEIIGMGNLGGYVLRPASVMYFYPAPENEGGTNLTFTLDAHPEVTYVLESSTNFTSWLPILTNVTTAITNTVTIPENSSSGAKYFRATLQP